MSNNPDLPVCENTDTFFPMLADIFYPIVDQGAYGNVEKKWVLDSSIACAFAPTSTKAKQDIQPQDINIKVSNILVGRTRKDIRFTSRETASAATNIILSNIRDNDGNPIYIETAGARAGKSTIFEIATNEPIVGAFGKVEYYKVVIRRSDNQAVNV